MTRQEAIKRLSLIMHSERIGWNPNTVEAFQMAIDALDEDKNVPSKDGGLISRQDAIHVVSGLDSSFVKYIEELPPAKPEPCDDCVSRKAVIRLLHSGYHSKSMIEEVKELPSVQPEIKPIDYQDCANAVLRMWMDNVVTDGEYNRIMDKLNAFWRAKHE